MNLNFLKSLDVTKFFISIASSRFLPFSHSQGKDQILRMIRELKTKLALKNLIRKKNLTYKHVAFPSFSIFYAFFSLYLREKLQSNSDKSLYCRQNNKQIDSASILKNKFIILEQPIIYIFYDDKNELQSEMADLIFNNLQQDYFNTQFNFDLNNRIAIKKISLKNLENSSDFISARKSILQLNNLKNKNEPIVLIQNQIMGEFINPYSLSSEIKEKTKIKLNNLLAYKNIQSLQELREEFRFLENPKQNIILINSDDLLKSEDPSNNFNKIISAFRDKNTKFLCVSNEELKKYLGMQPASIYKYYSSKLPYKVKDPDFILEDYFYKSPHSIYADSNLPVHEILTKEGIDLNSYMTSNTVGLMLKFGLFRDVFKISEELFKQNAEFILPNTDMDFLTTKPERIRLQKLISYPKRNVTQLGETDKKVIQHQWTQPNKHFLYIHVPNWIFLKENIFEYILFEASHLFDGVQITNSTNFSFKNGLYDDSQISGELPQIFIIETGDNPSRDKKVFSMSYFRFADDFNKYLKNRKEVFRKTEVIENFSYVQTVNSKNFEEKILKDNSFNEFMIEVKHEGCPTCYMLGKMFDHVSQKFNKHGYMKDFRFFRVDTHNDLPFLGEFAATPTYLFCKKNEKGQIEFISQVEKHEFIFKLRKLSKLDLSKVRYHPNIGFGFYVFQKQEFMKNNYDPDLDLSGFS